MGKGDRRGRAAKAKIELPGIAPVKRRVKQGRQRMREIQKEREAEAHDIPTLKARARQIGACDSDTAVLREMRSPSVADSAGRSLVLSEGHDGAAHLVETYGALRIANERAGRAMGVGVYPKSGKIEMMPDRMETSADAPPPDLRTQDERDEAAERAWAIWSGRLAQLPMGAASSIWTAIYGWADLHDGARITSAGQRFVAAMKDLHKMC